MKLYFHSASGRWVVAGLLAFAIGTIAMILISMQATSASAAPENQQPGDGPLGTYSVFARSASGNDDISGWRVRDDSSGLGLRFAEARLVYQDSVRAVAAVPATNGPCLITQFKDGSGGLNCGRRDNISVIVGYNGAFGIVPDSVKSVTFTLSGGATQSATVENNVWRSPAEAATVAFTLGGRSEEIPLTPRSSLPKGAHLSEDGIVTAAPLPGMGG